MKEWEKMDDEKAYRWQDGPPVDVEMPDAPAATNDPDNPSSNPKKRVFADAMQPTNLAIEYGTPGDSTSPFSSDGYS